MRAFLHVQGAMSLSLGIRSSIFLPKPKVKESAETIRIYPHSYGYAKAQIFVRIFIPRSMASTILRNPDAET